MYYLENKKNPLFGGLYAKGFLPIKPRTLPRNFLEKIYSQMDILNIYQ